MRYWKEDAVFEVPCPKCGASVELFKDESKGRCCGCGHRFQNPKLDLECAKWCAYAEECLGFTPDRPKSSNLGEGALASRLIGAVKDQFKQDQARITHALIVFQHTKELTWKEGGDPRVVFAAALLLDLEDGRSTKGQAGETRQTAKVKEILQEIGLDDQTIRRTCRVIHGCQTGEDLDTTEFKIVRDSHRLATMAAEGLGGEPEKLEAVITNQLTTEAAKQRARKLFLN